MHISYDRDSGKLFIPIDYFAKHEKELIEKLRDFVVLDKKETFVCLQVPNNLPRKKPYDTVYVKGEEKKESSCIFCSNRLRCITTDWKCTGYKPVNAFVKPISFIESLFPNEIILETRVY